MNGHLNRLVKNMNLHLTCMTIQSSVGGDSVTVRWQMGGGGQVVGGGHETVWSADGVGHLGVEPSAGVYTTDH